MIFICVVVSTTDKRHGSQMFSKLKKNSERKILPHWSPLFNIFAVPVVFKAVLTDLYWKMMNQKADNL